MAYIGKSPLDVGNPTSEDTFTASGGNLNGYTLGTDVDRESDIIVSINGVVQTNAAFSLSGRVLTFTSDMVVGDIVRVVHMGYRPTYTSVAANSIDGTKLKIGVTPVRGDFIYYDGTDYVKIGAGTSGKALLTGGTGGDPSWGTAAAPEIYGFSVDANGHLIVTTTNEGADNITGATYATFRDVLLSVSGYTWSISGTDLIATV